MQKTSAGTAFLLSTIQAEVNPEFLPDQQAGFRSGRSVRDQLLIFTFSARSYWRGGGTGVATWIDFKAAFDTMRRSTLIVTQKPMTSGLTSAWLW